MWRAYRNKFGGEVMVYVRSDLAADRKIQYEFREIESIGVEVTSGNEKCFFGGVYKPPSMSNKHFYTDFGQTIDKIISKYDKFIFIGDLTMICLTVKRVQCYEFNMNNIVQKAICFTKVSKATLLDLILTCQECDFIKVCNFGTGISDVYNYIAVQLNCDLPKMLPKKKLCRSFKNVDVTNFFFFFFNNNNILFKCLLQPAS
jgi:hypothetical protein